MSMRTSSAAALFAAVCIATACDRTETSSAKITTSSPAGTSTVPSSDAAKQRDDALVRVVHAVPSGAAFDLFAGIYSFSMDWDSKQSRHIARLTASATRLRSARPG
jgi:hypothetical protein